jgi:hypothetical protein
MTELIVLFKNKPLFASDFARSGGLHEAVSHLMAAQIDDVVKHVSANLPHLTKCLSLILGVVPNGLDWTPVTYDNSTNTGCFEAGTNHLYLINLLNGTILVDGVPPGFLPESVVTNPLY